LTVEQYQQQVADADDAEISNARRARFDAAWNQLGTVEHAAGKAALIAIADELEPVE
jgi:hypothetical protein